MRIPSGFARHIFAFHCLISRNHIFYDTRKHMTDMRFAVRRWRAVIERIRFAVFSGIHRLLENLFVFPKIDHLMLPFYKIHIRIYFAVHTLSPLCSVCNIKNNRCRQKNRKNLPAQCHIRNHTHIPAVPANHIHSVPVDSTA